VGLPLICLHACRHRPGKHPTLARITMSIETRSSAISTRTDTGSGGFFRHHASLAPGVRLLQRIGCPAKAMWIALIFTISLSASLVFLPSNVREQLISSRAERLGWTHVEPVLGFLEGVQDRRRSEEAGPADLPAAQEKPKSAFVKRLARRDELGKAFDEGKEFAELLKAHEELPQLSASANMDAAAQAGSALIAIALSLLSRIADGSQLVLDPDLNAHHRMKQGADNGRHQISDEISQAMRRPQ